MQIIDADLYAKGIERVYVKENEAAVFDSLRLIEEKLAKLTA